jgi:hypothetical protein
VVEPEQVERQNLELQVGGVGAEGARRDAVDPEVRVPRASRCGWPDRR